MGIRAIPRVGQSLRALFDQYPKLGSAFTGMATFGLGDVLSQTIHKHYNSTDEPINLKQSMQVGMLGFVANGLFLPNWYRLLDRVFGSSMTSKTGVLCKVLADQMVYAPFTIISYFSFHCCIRNDSLQAAGQALQVKLQHSLLTTWLADWAVWPAANAINFRFIPLVLRPVWTAFVQLLWQTYLAMQSESKDEEPVVEVVGKGG